MVINPLKPFIFNRDIIWYYVYNMSLKILINPLIGIYRDIAILRIPTRWMTRNIPKRKHACNLTQAEGHQASNLLYCGRSDPNLIGLVFWEHFSPETYMVLLFLLLRSWGFRVSMFPFLPMKVQIPRLYINKEELDFTTVGDMEATQELRWWWTPWYAFIGKRKRETSPTLWTLGTQK